MYDREIVCYDCCESYQHKQYWSVSQEKILCEEKDKIHAHKIDEPAENTDWFAHVSVHIPCIGCKIPCFVNIHFAVETGKQTRKGKRTQYIRSDDQQNFFN